MNTDGWDDYSCAGYGGLNSTPAHAVGPNDPLLRRAIGANEAYVDYLRWLPKGLR
jgi:hypothetical protein